MSRLLIAASGTGGHIFPALALAESLTNDWQVHWIGVPDRLERELVPKKYKLFTLNVGGLQGNAFRKLISLFRLLFASINVSLFIKRNHIEIVFTTGGYISAPAILGAKISGIPVVLHESNAIPGKVTRLLGRFCDFVALGFPPATRYLPNCRTIITGTPVREIFFISQGITSN